MLRFGLSCLLVLFAAGCGDLTKVAPPPVPLAALVGSSAAAGGDQDYGTASSTRLVRALPPKALVALHLPDIAGTARRFKKTSLYKMFTSPQMARLMGPMAAQFTALEVTGSNMAPRLLKAVQGEFALALEDITFGPTGNPVSVRLLGGVTVTGATADAEQMLQMISTMAAASPGTRVEKGNHGGAPFVRIVTTKPQHFVLEMALHRDALLVGVGRETVTQGLARLQSHAVESLNDNVAFHRAMARCADPRDAVRVFVDLKGVLERFGDQIPEEARNILAVLGLDAFEALTTVARLEGKDIVLSTFLDSPGGKDFITSMLSARAVDRQFFSRIPADASAFSLFVLDGKRILDHVRAKLSKDLVMQMERSLGKMRAAGFDLERDVFDVFGPRTALITLPHGTAVEDPIRALWNHMLGTAMVIDVRDPDAARQALKRLPRTQHGLRRREYDIEGVAAVSYHLEQSGLPAEFAPSYAYVDDFLVVTLCEQTLRRMLRPRPPEIAKKYRALFAHAPETVATLSYDDTRRGFGLVMTGLLRGIGKHTGRGAPRPAALNALTDDFNPTLSYTVADSAGVFMHTRSPTAGFGGMGGLTGLAVVASIAVPNFTIARQAANEAGAIETLRSIAVAQERFRRTAVRDSDGDQEGEFGFLAELMGKRRRGDKKARKTKQLVTGLSIDDEGYIVSKGYRFRVYLPAEDGSPIGGQEKIKRIRQVDGDLAEAVMVVVAWPVSRPGSGNRAFLLDSRGIVYECLDGPYSGDNAPPPDVVNSQRGNLASRLHAPKGKARDGFSWTLLRE